MIKIFCALLLDCIFGDPQSIRHPVVWIGRAITFFEKKLYRADGGRARGVLLWLCVTGTTAFSVLFALSVAELVSPWLRGAAEVYLLYAALALRSLRDESMKVATALSNGDIPAARRALSFIVGRDTERLGERDIIRATVETVAEGYIDGVVSPLFWMAVGAAFGQAALFAWIFKAASTMDSMVGYDDERYHDFGWAAAKLDDVLNFIPARLGGLAAIAGGALSGFSAKEGLRVFLRDRLCHRSPNSAHGESAFAGLLGLKLGGGAYYGGEFEARPTLGDDKREPGTADIERANLIAFRSTAVCAAAIFIAGRIL